ncbi:hypothetical protein F4818DRAFT_437526 [Hypoxylon cercidicola]|nr:hypothetical protein F4818DRAFT_437526 [Hypoxylon cercidicola]
MFSQPKKKPWEYSTNKNTLRVRARRARLTDYQREFEQAKASDSKAVTRAWKLEADTDTFKMASAKDQKIILQKVEREVMERRRYRGLDTETKVSRFMQRNNGPAIHSPPATIASPAPATDPAAEVPADATHNAVPFGPFLPYEDPPEFAHHDDEDEGQRFDSGISPSPSFHVDQTDGHSHLLPVPQTFRGYGGFDTLPLSSNAPVQRNLVAAPVVNADIQADLDTSRNQILHLKSQVDALTQDLVTARATITALEARMEMMDSRMTASHANWTGISRWKQIDDPIDLLPRRRYDKLAVYEFPSIANIGIFDGI